MRDANAVEKFIIAFYKNYLTLIKSDQVPLFLNDSQNNSEIETYDEFINYKV